MNKEFSKEELEVLSRMFPMWKIEMEDTYRYRDIDCGYQVGMEPHELLRTGFKSRLFVKENVNEPWQELPGLPQDLAHAHVRLEHIKHNYSYWKSCFLKENLIMFEYQGHMFKNPYVMWDQLAVSGDRIGGDGSEDDHIKIDFSLENVYVFTHPKDELVYFNGKLYLDGQMVAGKSGIKELEEKHGIKDYQWESFWDEKLLAFVKETWPTAKTYSGHLCSGTFRWHCKESQAVQEEPISE